MTSAEQLPTVDARRLAAVGDFQPAQNLARRARVNEAPRGKTSRRRTIDPPGRHDLAAPCLRESPEMQI
jgi:hypothetical protein